MNFKAVLDSLDDAARKMEREKIANDLDPASPPDGDRLLNAIHADIQTNHPEVSVTHRNIVLHAAATALRAYGEGARPQAQEGEQT